MVKLFPQTVYSCKISGKSKCVHILAVMKANGMPITEGYKLPKLSTLTRSKRNGKLNGRKKRGHRRNAKEVPLTSTQIVSTAVTLIGNSSQHEFEDNEALLEKNYHELDWDLQSLCQEVLNEEFFSIINEFLENGKKFDVDMIEIRSLSDFFIADTFNLNNLFRKIPQKDSARKNSAFPYFCGWNFFSKIPQKSLKSMVQSKI